MPEMNHRRPMANAGDKPALMLIPRTAPVPIIRSYGLKVHEIPLHKVELLALKVWCLPMSNADKLSDVTPPPVSSSDTIHQPQSKLYLWQNFH